MGRSRTVLRISFGLVVLTVSILLGLDLLGLIPRPDQSAEMEARVNLAQSVAARAASAVDRNDYTQARAILEGAVLRHTEMLSAGLRDPKGRLLVATRDHRERWRPEHETRSDAAHVRVPVLRSGRPAGTIEIRLTELARPVGLVDRYWENPLVRLLLVTSLLGFVSYGFYIRRTLRHLDPSAVIPTRVQAALDVMGEGVLLLDEHEQIVLANRAAASRLGVEGRSLLGVKPSAIEWSASEDEDAILPPWEVALGEARRSRSTRMTFRASGGAAQVFIVNAAPVLDGEGRARGAIVTFDDVTELERKSRELQEAMTQLEKSRDEVRLQNEELQALARTDPLTGVSNRRAFLETAADRFQAATEAGRSIACLMADIDHFKSINDTYGHSSGDAIIQRVAEAAVATVKDPTLVCRYGGEEFCILLPELGSKQAAGVAETLRTTVSQEGFADHAVTISIGVAALPDSHVEDLVELINQADEALYAAKAAGRDQVVRFEVVHAWR
jgi:diguanylate cyclase (GGDEF)-like protein/PAS domain S-box-containing protein